MASSGGPAVSAHSATPSSSAWEIRGRMSLSNMMNTGPVQQTPLVQTPQMQTPQIQTPQIHIPQTQTPQTRTHGVQLTNGNANIPVAIPWNAINTSNAGRDPANNEGTGLTGVSNLYRPNNWSITPPIDKPRKKRDSDSSTDRPDGCVGPEPLNEPSKKQKTVKKRNGATKRPDPNETGQGKSPAEHFVNHVGTWLKWMVAENRNMILDEPHGGDEENQISLASASTRPPVKHEVFESLVGRLADRCIPPGDVDWEDVFQPYKNCSCRKDSPSPPNGSCSCDWRAGWQQTKSANFGQKPESYWGTEEEKEGLTAGEVSLAREAFLPWSKYRQIRARIFLGFACLVEQNLGVLQDQNSPPDHPFRTAKGELKQVNLGPSQAQTVCMSIDSNPVSFVAKAYAYKGWLPQSCFKKHQALWEEKFPAAERARIVASFEEWQGRKVDGPGYLIRSSSSEQLDHADGDGDEEEEDEDADVQMEQ